MHRRFFLIAGGTLALLVIIILGRTFTYGGPPADVQAVTLVTPPGIDVARAAERLGQAIRCRTVTVAPGDPRIGQEGPWLEQQAWLAATYPTFHTVADKETIPGGYSLLYTWTGSDSGLKPLLLMAHQDVVPVNVGTENDWTNGAFSGAVANGYVYGRGAMDDKGSMVGLFEALDARVAKSPFPGIDTATILGASMQIQF